MVEMRPVRSVIISYFLFGQIAGVSSVTCQITELLDRNQNFRLHCALERFQQLRIWKLPIASLDHVEA